MKLRREARWLWPIAAIVLLALICGTYILNKQRLESPLAQRYSLRFEFTAVDAVTPGLGAPVTVAGVAVGQIDRVELRDGRGLLRASIDPSKLPRVHAGARAALIPNTPLKDMQVRLSPGRRSAPARPAGATIAAASTATPVDADELLRALDSDTRDWVRSLISDLGVGGRGRGRDLNAVLRSLGPTAAQLRIVTRLLAARRRELPRLIHNVRVVTEAAAGGDGDLRRVVQAGDATLATLAAAQRPLKRTLALLPPTLGAARSALRQTAPFATSLGRALARLDPALKSAPRTLRTAPGALRGLVPLPVAELTRFVDAVAPLAPSAKSAARDLRSATPPLRRALAVLARTVNQLASTPDPDPRSYLFWMAWFAHNANSALSSQDAHGAVARGYVLLSCSSVSQTGEVGAALQALLGAPQTCAGR